MSECQKPIRLCVPDGLLLLGSGFRVSPWGVPLLDYDGKPHLNEKLEMRNEKCEMVVRRIKRRSAAEYK